MKYLILYKVKLINQAKKNIMGCIKIDKRLQKSEGLAEFINFLFEFDRIKIPKLGLFEILLADLRPGLDDDFISNDIISKFEKIGIPTGPLEGGRPNVMEEYTKILVSSMVDSIQNDMRVDVAVSENLPIQATGANAGGPIQVFGTSILPHQATGIAV
jgi:hypothetical protein